MKEFSKHWGGKIVIVLLAFFIVGVVVVAGNGLDSSENYQGNLNLKDNEVGLQLPNFDLDFEPGSIVLDPDVARVGQELEAKMTVRNVGDFDIVDNFGVNVRLGTTEVRKVSINGLKMGQQQDVYVQFDIDRNLPWRSKATLVAEIDPENIISEVDEANNIAQKIVEIQQ